MEYLALGSLKYWGLSIQRDMAVDTESFCAAVNYGVRVKKLMANRP
jgi:hypothetical protein